jgi:hypothetical protein
MAAKPERLVEWLRVVGLESDVLAGNFRGQVPHHVVLGEGTARIRRLPLL